MMSEYNFVQKFINAYNQRYNLGAIQASGKNQSTYADCEIVYNGEVVKIEAKMLRDTRSNSSHFYNVIGESIATSSKQSILQKNGCFVQTTCGAFLVPCSGKKTFLDLWRKNIDIFNGNSYCGSFKVKYLITFDERNNNIQFFSYDPKSNRWV